MISYKEYKEGRFDVLVAACDLDLLGKTFYDAEKGLKLEVSKDFYSGSEITAEEFGKKLRKVSIANLVGAETIGKAIEIGLVAESSVLKIGGVPHVQIVHNL